MLMIDGLVNFRDTGGMPLTKGGVTRVGVLFRSAALGSLTPQGIESLAATDIGVVVDFRTDAERSMTPDLLPTTRTFNLVELPLLQGAMSDMTKKLAPGDGKLTPEAIEQAMNALPSLGDLYVGMLAQAGPHFVEVAQLIAASADGAPTAVLVHCTAGKDRTGVATAVMLDAAGVAREAIIADYAASQEHLAGPWAEGMLTQVTSMGLPITPRLRTLITGTPPEAIEQALTWLDDEHGGSANYLTASGLSEAELAGLRGRIAD